MASLNQFKKDRATIKGQLTRTQNTLSAFRIGETDPMEVEARLQKVYELWAAFEVAQSGIEEIDDSEAQIEERVHFENAYFKAVATAKKLCAPPPAGNDGRQRTPSVQQDDEEVGSTTNIKLPTLSLPKFDGTVAQWLPFRDTFDALIDKNSNLTNIQKFYYLRSSLQGSASYVIQSLEITSENYEEAWELLKERFENKRLLIHYHVQALFDLESIHKESASQLRKLVDDVLKHLRALKTLGQPVDNWDSLVIHMITTKLDPVTRRKWETSITSATVPTRKLLTDFLMQHCSMLETLYPGKPTSGKSIKPSTAPKKAEESVACISSKTEQNSSETKTCPSCEGEHSIYHCSKFKGLTTQAKWNEVKRIKVCFNCLRGNHLSEAYKSSTCKRCGKKHNTLLHIEEFYPKSTSNSDQSTSGSVGPSTGGEPSRQVMLSSMRTNKTHVMLSTALIIVNDKFGKSHVCRAVLDCGSQSNFLTKALHRRLQLPERSENVSISGVNLGQTHTKRSVDATIKSRVNAFKVKLPFLVIDHITQPLPSAKICTQEFQVPDNITLADPSFNVPGEVDVLLGAGVFWNLLCVGQHIISRNQPLLHKTKLGWIVGGTMASPSAQSENARSAICCFATERTIHDQMERFWCIEEYQPTRHFSEEELHCEKDFVASHQRDETGRFTVALSFSDNPKELGESREIAIKRLHSLNRKLDKQPELKTQYQAFLDEYLALGHMTELTDKEKTTEKAHCYIPHHCVLKESSTTTKLRVVFDASCKTSSGKSLNDILRVGPTIQQELFSILARFRQHQYVLTADIQKMYRQIKIRDNHRDFQRIVWRVDVQQPIKEYKLNTVTYGTATAPFLAIRSLHQLAYDCEDDLPKISEVILRDFYVDDLLTGCDDIANLKVMKKDLDRILLSGGFPLRKWTSNAPSVVDTSLEDPVNFDRPIGEEITTLGLIWNSLNDTFRYRVNIKDVSVRPTKRNILSAISQIYDPLGLVGPSYIKAKIILQQLWRLKIGWDESLPNDLHETWKEYHTHLSSINEISIPRAVVCQDPTSVELHGFCDASETAYGACIYIRSRSLDNQYTVRLLCAKSRVAPLKSVSLPRLELCGAVLLARLTQKITEAFTIQFNKKYYWSDSQIALSWIVGEACQWKTFVANRVAEIQELTDKAHWQHVRSEENPADVISRGVTPDQLQTRDLWWTGPSWLLGSIDEYLDSNTEIQNEDVIDTTLLEAKPVVSSLAATIDDFNLLDKYSSLRKLKRVVAYCQRFVYNSRHPTEKRSGPLSVEELTLAEKAVIGISQAEHFLREVHNLRKKLPVPTDSKLASLHPFIDADGLIRVGERLQEANLPYAQRFPIVLAPGSALTQLIIRDAHLRNLHAGLQALLSTLNESYWILSARSTVKQALSKCVTCFRFRPKYLQQIMGNLPSVRVSPSRAFLNVGVDYGGPFRIKISRNKTGKAYLCLFVCLVTRAIHLELVSDLSTVAFLNSLKRFIGRRGKCANIYSDNGTNFTGAHNELKDLTTLIQTEAHKRKIIDFSADNSIQWHFIPPYSPHMGGIWEAGIKSAKTHLKRVLGDALLSFEELYTLLTEIEACLNSRPLVPMSSDPSDLSALTPGHFLIGSPLTAIPQLDLQDIKSNRLTRYQLLIKLHQHFWTRWSHEYLTQLQSRTKWKEGDVNNALKIDTLVLLKDDKLPPLQWKIGRITEIHPGRDGRVRVVSVKTSNGITQRSVPKICVLPTTD